MHSVSTLKTFCISSLRNVVYHKDKNIEVMMESLRFFHLTKQDDRIPKIITELLIYYKKKKEVEDIVDKILQEINKARPEKVVLYLGCVELEKRFELAKIVAEKNPSALPYYIRYFDITDEEKRFELAKIVVEKDLSILVYYIRDFDIADEEKRFELAKILAEKNPLTLAKYIKNFDITDKEKRFELAKIVAEKNPSALAWYIKHFNIRDNEKTFERLKILCELIINKVFEKRNLPKDLSKIQKLIYEEKNIYRKIALIKIFISVLTPGDRDLKKIEFLAITSKIILKTFELRDYEEIKQTIDLVKELYKKNNQIFDQFIYSGKEEKLYIASLYLVEYPNRDHILSKFIKHGFLKKDDSKMRSFVDFLKIIQVNEEITNEEKGNLLYYVLDTKTKETKHEILSKISKIKGLVYSGNERKLFEKPFDELNLDSLLEDLFKKLFNIQNFPDFTKKLEDSILKFRNPWNVLIYASKMKTLPEREVILALLKEYVESILNNNFKEFRYREKSKHLQTIFQDKELKRVWIEDEEMLVAKTDETKEFKFKDYVFIKLIADIHIQDLREKLPLLFSFLTEETIGGAGGALTEHEDLEREIIRSIESNSLQNIDKLIEVLSKVEDFKTFAQDLKELKRQTSKKETGETICTMVDEPEDYISIASETEGCQRVDGDPRLNMGLIGYIVDGKNRIVAVKDKKTGKLIARSLLRLLWDKKEGKPALLLERMYPSTLNSQNRDAIIKMAIKKAHKMSLKLFSNQVVSGVVVDTTLDSIDSIAPFEYCDSSSGVIDGIHMTYGKYQVENLHIVNSRSDGDSI